MSLHPKIYGNFRERGPKKRKNSERYLKRPGMSEAHLACIRQLPCCVCGGTKHIEAHHLKATAERGMGLRSTDKWAVPACGFGGQNHCHEDIERLGSKNEVAWFATKGVDVLVLAMDLWAASGNVARMREIVIAHRSRS